MVKKLVSLTEKLAANSGTPPSSLSKPLAGVKLSPARKRLRRKAAIPIPSPPRERRPVVQQEVVKETEQPGNTRGRLAALVNQAIAELEDESYRKLEKGKRRKVTAAIIARTGVKSQVIRHSYGFRLSLERTFSKITL